MKNFTLLLCMSLVALAAYSQKEDSPDGKTVNKLNKQQKEEHKKVADLATALLVESMVTNRTFYLEINFMSDESRAFSQSNGFIDVSSQMNYIAIDSNKIILQLEPDTYLTTNWGIVNLPINGNLLQYNLRKLKKTDDGYFISFRTTGRIGERDISLTVLPNGKADLKMMKNNGETLIFRGVLIPLNQSGITAKFI